VTDDTVRVNQTRERIAGAPRYDPELVRASDYYGDLYGYYGFPAYYGPGYVYPSYPYAGAGTVV